MSVELIIGIAIVALGFAIYWGVQQSRNRPRGSDQVTAAATRDLYRAENDADR